MYVCARLLAFKRLHSRNENAMVQRFLFFWCKIFLETCTTFVQLLHLIDVIQMNLGKKSILVLSESEASRNSKSIESNGRPFQWWLQWMSSNYFCKVWKYLSFIFRFQFRQKVSIHGTLWPISIFEKLVWVCVHLHVSVRDRKCYPVPFCVPFGAIYPTRLPDVWQTFHINLTQSYACEIQIPEKRENF